ncbi:hypothetical protein ACLOJK_028180 [Asimina triloba]
MWMGHKPGSLKINGKTFANLNRPCMQEMLSFLNCLALSQNNDEKCARQKERLNACMDAQCNDRRSYNALYCVDNSSILGAEFLEQVAMLRGVAPMQTSRIAWTVSESGVFA